MTHRSFTALATFFLLIFSLAALAQDPAWDDRFGLAGPARAHTDGQVHGFLEHEGELWMVGEFTEVGGQPAQNVARWNGTTWGQPGAPSFGSSYWSGPVLRDIVAYQGGLAVAGSIQSVGEDAGSVGFWNGSEWSGLDVAFTYHTAPVYSLAADADLLYLGGEFDQLVVAWDGSQTIALVTAATANNGSPRMNDLVIWQGDLIAGGSFTSLDGVEIDGVARWDGAAWHPLGDVGFQLVEEVFVQNGDLYALSVWSDQSVYRWDGEIWVGVPEARIGCSGLSVVSSEALFFAGDLYVSGVTWSSDGGDLGGVGRWTDGHWESLAGGMDYDCWDTNMGALYEYDGRLLVGGVFEQASGMAMGNLGAWDSAGNWYTGGPTHRVRAMVEHGGDIYVAGDFFAAFETEANHVVRWDGENWHALGDGVDGPVHALAFVGDDLYVGGDFSEAGGISAHSIARWDGVGWHAVGDPLIGSGVYALGSDGQNLYVGGTFYGALGMLAPRIMRWDGAQWHDMAGGIGDGSVRSIVVGDDLVYVAGDFTEAGSTPTGNVVAWDGDGWTNLEVGFDGPVQTLAIHAGELYAGGEFQHVLATNEPVRNVGRWDGEHWHRLGPPVDQGVDGPVRGLTGGVGGLFVVGDFGSAGGQPAVHLARWNGSAWDSPGDLDAPADVVLGVGSQLFLGGEFVRAGGHDSHHFARWQGTVTAGPGASPTVVSARLEPPYPNPFNPQTTFRYYVAHAGHVRLAVFDLRGRHVKTLVDGHQSPVPGGQSVVWSGDAEDGRRVGSGVYFVQLIAGDQRLGQTVVMIK